MPRKKAVRYTSVTQKDIENVRTLYNTNHFSISGISNVTGRAWGTINQIVESDFNLRKYKQLQKAYRLAHSKNKPLTFKPFNGQKTPGPVKVSEIPKKPKMDMSKAQNMDDVLDIMWNMQQDRVKTVSQREKLNSTIHKMRDALQKFNEALGELL